MENENRLKNGPNRKITRKIAIKKTGLTALTAATFVFLQTNASPPGSFDTIQNASRAPKRGR